MSVIFDEIDRFMLMNKHLLIARLIAVVHFCVVIAFFVSPFLSLPIKILVVLVGISTIPVRIIFFDKQCPLTKLERKYRKNARDYHSPIHKNSYMEVYFKMPDAMFDKVEKAIVLVLLFSIGLEIWSGITLAELSNNIF